MRVVVNADDLGLAPEVDEAILDGLDSGWLTDASVLVTGPDFASAAGRLRGRALGLHVDVSEFPGITDATGRWRKRGAQVGPGTFPFAARDALEVEARAQADRAHAAGIRLTHLDSHQHMHWQPVVLHALLAVARRLSIPFVRGVGTVPPAGLLRRGRAWAVATRVRWAGAATVGAFGPAARVRTALARGWRADTLEIMCHPGRSEAGYVDEVAWLRTVDWREYGAEVCSYAGLATEA